MTSNRETIRQMIDQGQYSEACAELAAEPLSAWKFLFLAELALWDDVPRRAEQLLAGVAASLLVEQPAGEFSFWHILTQLQLELACHQTKTAWEKLETIPRAPTGSQGEAYLRLHRAHILFAQGKLDRALDEAETALRMTERGFHTYPLILMSLGRFRAEFGELEEAEKNFEQASRAFARLRMMAHHGLALVRVAELARRKRDFVRADEFLDEAIALFGTIDAPREHAHALLFQAEMCFERQKTTRIEGFLASAGELLAAYPDDWRQGWLVLLEIRYHIGRHQFSQAAGKLDAAFALVRHHHTWGLETQLFLFGAEACRQTDPAVAAGYFETARSRIGEPAPVWLREELERISKQFGQKNSISTAAGVLTIVVTEDVPNDLFPSWNEALESVKRFLLTAALKRTEGSLTKTAALLKVSIGHVSQRCKEYNLTPRSGEEV
ncbi:MAG: hypothetical protein K1Y36_17370 [Blastocatellia bacterium]|nr:hypothetical protein [Blastocatellia bacterium]